MLVPPKAPDEKYRLQALRALNVLDTEDEERFDRVTRLARRLFNVPIALVSLVDENRQWFKSCYGLDVRETGRDISFCGHAILGEGVFVIENALEDERFADNPLVSGPPGIRFYAGVPLELEDGYKLGTLCIIDDKPREFDQEQIQDLIDLAKMAEQELVAKYSAGLDELTGLSNRRGFSGLTTKALSYCFMAGLPASLVYLDLNRFKDINDKFGHQAGDQALVRFSSLLCACYRDSDVVARVGGDEFVVFMAGADQAMAESAIDRLFASLDELNQSGQFEFNIEFCHGIVECAPDMTTSIDDLIKQADERMYCMKGQLR
ncbi:sensor domain-containing diguanylate cyclase [Vibrio sp. SCSIO 43136]|uniref:GGDEF domain-containing protein n=1 Tax=Vibrio sp. SCSIO 43136 TaxID=2819101 RepID=UPI0020750E3F|nr:sensor domain-containing diguanylate cyclase [Vibrio sp. SCSIO 43136]USD65595.1 sensor domain-containing diguanylate cyclase [Vibrio sp. SCSIO 43136]